MKKPHQTAASKAGGKAKARSAKRAVAKKATKARAKGRDQRPPDMAAFDESIYLPFPVTNDPTQAEAFAEVLATMAETQVPINVALNGPRAFMNPDGDPEGRRTAPASARRKA